MNPVLRIKTGVIFVFLLAAAGVHAETRRKPGPGQAVPAPPQEAPSLRSLMDDLKSTDPVRRRDAAEDLGRLKYPHATPALVVALSDEDAGVRAAAADALGRMGTEDAVGPLSRLLAEDPSPNVRQTAAQSLTLIGSPPALAALTKGLQSALPDVRRLAARALGDSGQPSAAGDLRPLLKDPDVSARIAAVRSLGALKDEASRPALQGFLSRRTPVELRLAAAESLARQGDDSGTAAALQVLKDQKEAPENRAWALRVIDGLAGPSLVKPLQGIYKRERDPAIRDRLRAILEHISTQG
jgi:HEAT repeat protein